MNVYFISGFGADETVFHKINLPEGFDIKHVHYIPALPSESFKEYAARMAESINTDQPFCLLGLSMGGMIAVEISKLHKPVSLVLLSSAATCEELPARYKFLGKYSLQKLAPISMLKYISVVKKVFYKYSTEDREILVTAIKKTDPAFVKWGLSAILGWDNTKCPAQFYHIHGTADNVLPMKNTNPTHIIDGGNHFMVLNRADEINEILSEILLAIK